MPINKNHEFEDLNGYKCSIVEKNIDRNRAEFLKNLLVQNGYTVVIVPSPPPKTAAAKPATDTNVEQQTAAEAPTADPTFTLGVTDLTFNPTNAIFGRLLKTASGNIVTQAYWLQQEAESHSDEPYYMHTVLKNKGEN